MASAGVATATGAGAPNIEQALAWHRPAFVALVTQKLALPEKEAKRTIRALKQFLIAVAMHPNEPIYSPRRIDAAWHWLILDEAAREDFFRVLGARVTHDPHDGGPTDPRVIERARKLFGDIDEEYWQD